MPSIDCQALLDAAKDEFAKQDYIKAIPLLVKLIKDKDYRVKGLSSLGACLFYLSHYRAARVFLERALIIDAGYLPARHNLASTLYTLKCYEQADREFCSIIQMNPEDDAAWQGRYHCCSALGRIDECRSILLGWPKALQTSPTFVLASAQLLRLEGKKHEAIQQLHNFAGSEHAGAEVYALMCEIFHETHRLQDSLKVIRKAISLQPNNIFYLCMEANIHYLCSDVDKCSKAFEDAARLHPRSAALLLNQHLLFPVIPSSSHQIDECRARFDYGLNMAETMPQLELVYEHPMSLHTFSLAYHNKDDRGLLERYSALMRKLAAPLLSHLHQARSELGAFNHIPKFETDKLRIGFLSKHFYGHSNTIAFQGLIRLLNRDQFNIYLIHVHGSLDDDVRKELDSFADHVIYLSNDLSVIYNQLHDLELDILYFTDLGMTPYDFLFPFFRSAPIQITGWGIPHTSGNDSVDYYISSDGIEPEGADSLYTEKLVRLPGGLPCCCYSASFEVADIGREYFFLPHHCKLVGCLQSLHKLHPDFDHLLEDIALRNPDAIFVFVGDEYDVSTERFLQRLATFAPSARDQTIVLKKMSRGEYQALCKCMDLLLDPIYYGSGITFFEAVLSGTPIITLEGSYLRSRVVAAGYREMAIINAPITQSLLEYAEVVHELLEHDDKRCSLRRQILNQKHRIFNRADYVRHFEQFCIAASKGALNCNE
ncbi:hypothetical protein [Cyanobium sp. Lug-B]|uniref:O-linked N-acetylglucosamine transferase family protein n=1 Tax=Cyanobium sp. Lug-B TaxID=2823716 RepID=UPI0020CE128C|nr:hypothetical protein [Cyanobium sp. Lug-B]MCP9798086.1 hypothetical protein [Cyanobium sp. Lug-B]